MIEKIKSIFTSLNSSRKDNIRKRLSDLFDISLDTARTHWLYNGNIPKKHQSEVYNLLVEEMEKQISENKNLIENETVES